ncbi:T9SS type A sorting domain-containing protein [Adhaeribacter arboris]|nr:T9SS type A sorting domain-containing protein [Adhaeribacter arboris]
MKQPITKIYRLRWQCFKPIFYGCSWVGMYLLFTITLPTQTFAQNIQWDKTFGGNNNEYLSVVQQTKDGGFILGGTSKSGINGDKTQNNRGESDFWIVKLNADGSKAWDKTFGGIANDQLSAVQQTADGGFILGGNSTSGKSGDKSQAEKGLGDFWIVKLDSDGNKTWDKTIGGTGYDALSTLKQTSDGGYILGCSSSSDKSGDKSENNKGTVSAAGNPTSDFWIVKLKSDGTKEWDKTFGGSGEDGLQSLQQTQEGGYILGGISYSDKSGDKTEANRGCLPDYCHGDYWVVKIDNTGNKQWDKTFGGVLDDKLTSLQQTTDKGYILGGYSESFADGDKTEGNKSRIPAWDYWIVKLGANGVKIWDKTFGGEYDDLLTNLQPTQDGGYILGGYSYSKISGDKSEANEGDRYSPDYWILKINSTGTKIWDKTFGGKEYDELFSLQQSQDGGYILGGHSSSGISGSKTEATRGGTDFWVIKLSEKATQTITFAPISDKTILDAPFPITAKASSGLPVTFRIQPNLAKVKGDILTPTGIGKVTVIAFQAGNASYAPAEAKQIFTIKPTTLLTKQWDKTIGGNNNDVLVSFKPTSDGGYILGGYSTSTDNGDKTEATRDTSQFSLFQGDYWIVKLKYDGSEEWDKTFGGNNQDLLHSIQQTQDGGYILGGTSFSGQSGDKSEPNKGPLNSFGEPTSDFWLLKLNAAGNKVWDKTIGGASADQLFSLELTKDGGYILGGTSYSGLSGDKSEAAKGMNDFSTPTSDYWVVKINSKGIKEWDKTIGTSLDDEFRKIQQTREGGYILGGYTLAGKSGDKTEPNKGHRNYSDYWIIKLNATGGKIWDKTIGSRGGDELTTLQQTQDGGYIVGGLSGSQVSGDKTERTKGAGDYWVVKLKADGSKEWDKTIGSSNADQLTSLHQTQDGGYILGGYSLSGISGDKSEPKRGNTYNFSDYWVVKLKADGTKTWDKTFGSIHDEQLAEVYQTQDGNFILGGTSWATDPSDDKSELGKGESDFWIVKLEDNTVDKSAWNMRYGGASFDQLTSVIQTSDGGYLSGGYTYSGSSGDKTQDTQGKIDYWIVKSDKKGRKLWDKRYGGTFDDFLNRVIQTQDGGYLLAGTSRSNKNGDKSEVSRDAGKNYFKEGDFWLVKVDSLGNKQWDKTLGGSGLDELEKVIQLSSGEYVLAGYSNSPVSGEKSQDTQGGSDYWLVKVSAKGTKIWDKRFGGTLDEVLGSFTQTQDGGFLLGGTSYSGRNRDKSEMSRGKSDYWIVRTDKDGNKLWDKTFGGSGEDYLRSLGRSNGGNFFLAGTSSSPKSGEKSQAGYLDEVGYATSDYWLIKIDAQGNKVWDKTFGSKQGAGLQASTRTNDGGYVLAGISSSDKGGDKTENGKGNRDYWVVKLDANGIVQWDKTIGGTERDDLRTVFQTNDGGLLLGGSSNSPVSGDKTQPSRGFSDYWLVKLAPETSSIAATREASIIEESLALINLITAYPNPVREKVTIKFTLPQTEAATVKIYDSQGQEVTTLFQGEAKAKQTYQLKWQAGNKQADLYFLQLQTPTLRQQQKLLLSK